MNIIHLLSQNHLTGAEVYAAQLIEQQVSDRHIVYQISNDFFRKTQAFQLKLAVETKSKLQFWKNVLWLRRFIREKNIQVIHTHSRASAKLAFWARLGLRVGLVSTIHGRQHYSLSKRLMNHYGDFLLAVCENIESHLIEDFKYNPRRILVSRNPISSESFSFLKTDESPRNLIKVAVIGRTTGPKGTRSELILNTLPALMEELGLKAEYYLVGGDKADLKNLSHPNLVQVVSYPQLTSQEYSQYDLVIGSGRVALEALISGVATISFGEAKYEGLTRLSFLKDHYRSNFGDIDSASTMPSLPREKLKQDLKDLSELRFLERKQISKTLLQDFNHLMTARRVLRTYESAYFLCHYAKWIPVLMYHKIPKTEIESQHKIYVTEDNFKKHLEFFKNQGFTTLTFSELKLFKSGKKSFSEFPKKPLVLTFDDGYRDNLENASPLMKSFGFKAQLFLLADKAMNSNSWDQSSIEPAHEIISGVDRQKWKTSAFEVGSHGFNHKKITQMPEFEARRELHDSKCDLENEFCTDISVYAFTYGDTNKQCATWAFEEGYDYAVNTDTGGLLLEEDPYAIFRVNIFPHETTASLKKKTSTWYRRYYHWKRKK